MIDLQTAFKKHEDEYLEFGRVEHARIKRRDLFAFMLLDKLAPSGSGEKIVSSAGYDEIWLGVDCEKLAETATDDDILALVRCGVRYDEYTDSLAMFV